MKIILIVLLFSSIFAKTYTLDDVKKIKHVTYLKKNNTPLNGTIISEETSEAFDTKTGAFKQYFIRKNETPYVNGKIDGVEISTNKYGKVERKKFYTNGNHYMTQSFYGGFLLEENNYKNNQKHGKCKRYNIWSNKINSISTYENAKIISVKHYYKSGEIKSVTIFKDDFPYRINVYYTTGKLKAEIIYKTLYLFERTRKEYDINGNLIYEVDINNNSTIIKGYVYDKNGNKKEMNNAQLHNAKIDIDNERSL